MSPQLKRLIKILIVVFAIGFWLFVAKIVGEFILFANTQRLYGFVDRTGRFVIPPQYEEVEDFNNGKVRVSLTKHDSACFTKARFFTYLLDRQGKIIETTYTACSSPSGSVAAQGDNAYKTPYFSPTEEVDKDLVPHNLEESSIPTDRSKVGYISAKTKQWVIEPQFDDGTYFSHGVAWVRKNKGNNWHWGLINKKGQFLLPPKCRSTGAFHDGLAWCRLDVSFGIFY